MKKIVIILLISLNFSCFSQSFNQQERQIIAYNILFGGINGGIGAAINKPKHEKTTKAFIKGFYKGCIGGTLMYAGKRTSALIKIEATKHDQITSMFRSDFRYNSFGYGWAGKLIHTTGASIVENASTGRGFLEDWTMDYGPIRMSFNTKNLSPSFRLKAEGSYRFIQLFFHGKLSIKKSLLIGTPYFISNPEYAELDFNGRHKAGSIIVNEGHLANVHQVTTHEYIHSLQERENSIYLYLTYKTNSKFMNKYGSYKFIGKYLCVEPIYVSTVRWIIQPSRENYFKSYSEMEAQHIATNQYVSPKLP